MRIAFVGKGGAGKTTLASLFGLWLAHQERPILMVDADLNMHMGRLLGREMPSPQMCVSSSENAYAICHFLKGENSRIHSVEAFRKTTPPGRGSKLIYLHDPQDWILSRYTSGPSNSRLLTVGTYQEDEIGTSCYHNHLAILENILSHLDDRDGIVVADMVAGVDAFASTLYAQFDALVLVVEPTWRGVEVYRQYAQLAHAAGCEEALCVIGNKVTGAEDACFLEARIPAEKLLGFCADSAIVRAQDKGVGMLSVETIDAEQCALFEQVLGRATLHGMDPQTRLVKLWELHRRYVAQESVRARFGDLTDQIDPLFRYVD